MKIRIINLKLKFDKVFSIHAQRLVQVEHMYPNGQKETNKKGCIYFVIKGVTIKEGLCWCQLNCQIRKQIKLSNSNKKNWILILMHLKVFKLYDLTKRDFVKGIQQGLDNCMQNLALRQPVKDLPRCPTV